MKSFDDFPQVDQLLQLARLVQHRLDEQLRDIGLNTNQFFTLREIDRITRGGELALRAKISKRLGMSPTTMSDICRKLQASKLIFQWSSEPFLHDKTRQKYVKLSPSGSELLVHAIERWRDINRNHFNELKDRQLREFEASMRVIHEAILSNDGLA